MSIAIIFTYLKEYKKLFGIEPDMFKKRSIQENLFVIMTQKQRIKFFEKLNI